MWYGPSGIGTTRGYKEFEDFHQDPFLEIFPKFGCEYAGLHVVEVVRGTTPVGLAGPASELPRLGNTLDVRQQGKKSIGD